MKTQEIRAIQFIDSYFPVTDGVVETVHNYASIMNRQGFCAVVAPAPQKKFDDGALPYPIFRTARLPLPLKEYSMALPRADFALRRFVREAAPALLHAHSPFAEGQFAAFYARKLDIPCISTFHSKYYDDALQITGSPAIARAVVKNIVRHYESVDSVWTCSESTAETLRGYGYRGEIFIMDNGSSLWYADEEKRKYRERARAAFHLPRDKKVLLFVGHLIWQKNLKTVLDTMRLLCDQTNGYHLVIAGEGYRQEEIRRYAKSLEIEPQFTGMIADRELLAGLYAASDLFFFPSIYDNTPLVVREAASMGLASLLAEGSNAAESVKKDVSGFTAPNDSAAMAEEIMRIFRHPELLKAVSAEAERAIPQSWETIAGRAQEKYSRVLDEYRFRENRRKAL